MSTDREGRREEEGRGGEGREQEGRGGDGREEEGRGGDGRGGGFLAKQMSIAMAAVKDPSF